MLHECRVQCHSIDIKSVESFSLEESSKWLPFIFDMDIIDAAKLSSDDPESPAYNCTTIFTKNGDSYIIDTEVDVFFRKFIEYNSFMSGEETDPNEDLEL